MCLPLPWGGSASALIPCLMSHNSLQCCPLEATHPIRLLAVISPALLVLFHHKPPDSLMTGTINCATLGHPPRQCFHWPQCQDWKVLVTGTSENNDVLLSFLSPLLCKNLQNKGFKEKARLIFFKIDLYYIWNHIEHSFVAS